jgi:hypothetical protein
MAKKADYSFPKEVKRVLGERVAYICCDPMCRRLAIRRNTDTDKALRFGDAAHIYSKADKGPRGRYVADVDTKILNKYENGIWLCKICHKKVDSEESTHTIEKLLKWKHDTEIYIETLVTQDTRLRQLRLICHHHLSALRIMSALPTPLEKTIDNPNGNGVNMTRIFMELELVLFDNEFYREADIVKQIMLDLDYKISPFVNNNKSGNPVNISEWKNLAVEVMMKFVMRFKVESYDRYLSQEMEMVNRELAKFPLNSLLAPEYDLCLPIKD